MVGLNDEEKSLDLLLNENYNSLTYESGKKCAERTVSYIDSILTVEGKDFDFTKRLTKVGDHISVACFPSYETQKKERQAAVGWDYASNITFWRNFKATWFSREEEALSFLKKLYVFNLEGAASVKGLKEKKDQRRRKTDHLEAHLLAYAGNAAKRIFSYLEFETNTGEERMEWGRRWYEAYLHSAMIAEFSEPKDAPYKYGFAANAAWAMYLASSENDVQWLVESFNKLIKSGKLAEKVDKKRAAFSYSTAASRAEQLIRHVGGKSKPTLAEEKYKCHLRSAKFFKEIYEDGERAGENHDEYDFEQMYGIKNGIDFKTKYISELMGAADAAENLHKLASGDCWLWRRYDAYQECLDFYESLGKNGGSKATLSEIGTFRTLAHDTHKKALRT